MGRKAAFSLAVTFFLSDLDNFDFFVIKCHIFQVRKRHKSSVVQILTFTIWGIIRKWELHSSCLYVHSAIHKYYLHQQLKTLKNRDSFYGIMQYLCNVLFSVTCPQTYQTKLVRLISSGGSKRRALQTKSKYESKIPDVIHFLKPETSWSFVRHYLKFLVLKSTELWCCCDRLRSQKGEKKVLKTLPSTRCLLQISTAFIELESWIYTFIYDKK